MIGREVDVLVDSYSTNGVDKIISRMSQQAPDIDGVTILKPMKNLSITVGQIVKARITSSKGYDLVAEVAA